jgi:hypothetical protein
MNDLAATDVKPSKTALAKCEFARLLEMAGTRGFFGTAGITLIVQDGRIQQLRISTDRMVR